jgi:hypothetical protein
MSLVNLVEIWPDFELDIMDIMLDKQSKQKGKSVRVNAQKANKPQQAQALNIREANENMSISDSITYAPSIDHNQVADATNTETDDSAMDLVASADESSFNP